MSKGTKFVKSSVSTEAYEPFMLGDKQAGEVHWLTQTNSDGQASYSGLWRCEPMSFDYEFPGDEILHVLQGSLQIEIAGGDAITVQAGDIVAFDKGLKSVWTVQSSFKKFFVITNC